MGLKQTYWALREAARNKCRDLLVDPARSCVVRGQEFTIGFSSPLEGYRISTFDSKEPETLDWLDGSLRDGDVFFDVGANIGLYSIYAAKRRPKANIYSFEPAAANFVRLSRNVRLNDVKNVTMLNLALHAGTRFDYMHLSDWESGSALHQFGGDKGAASLRQGIMSASLDDLVGRWGLPQPHLLKIDVDGNEPQILAGATQVLGNPQLREILIEISQYGSKEDTTLTTLKSYGFKVGRVSDWSVRLHDQEFRNYVLCR